MLAVAGVCAAIAPSLCLSSRRRAVCLRQIVSRIHKGNVEKACGKFPTNRFASGSYSSDSKPTSLARRTIRSKIARASSRRPKSTRLSTSQNVQGRNIAWRQAVDVRMRRVANHEPVTTKIALDDHPLLASRRAALVAAPLLHLLSLVPAPPFQGWPTLGLVSSFELRVILAVLYVTDRNRKGISDLLR